MEHYVDVFICFMGKSFSKPPIDMQITSEPNIRERVKWNKIHKSPRMLQMQGEFRR